MLVVERTLEVPRVGESCLRPPIESLGSVPWCLLQSSSHWAYRSQGRALLMPSRCWAREPEPAMVHWYPKPTSQTGQSLPPRATIQGHIILPSCSACYLLLSDILTYLLISLLLVFSIRILTPWYKGTYPSFSRLQCQFLEECLFVYSRGLVTNYWINKWRPRDFPGGPVAKTSCFQCTKLCVWVGVLGGKLDPTCRN